MMPSTIDAFGLLLQVGLGRPQGQRRLDRPLAFQPQVDTLRLVRLEAEFEQVVVLPDRPTGERQCVAGALGEAVAALAIGQVEVELVQRRIGQLQQPGARIAGGDRPVVQVQAQPEHRARIAGIEHVLVMAAEAAVDGPRGDVVDIGATAHVLEHVDGLPQRQALDLLVEAHRTRQARQRKKKENQPVPHDAPQCSSNGPGAPPPSSWSALGERCMNIRRTLAHATPHQARDVSRRARARRPKGRPRSRHGALLVVSSRAMKTPTSRPVVLCLSGHDPSGGAGLQADIEALLAQGCHAAPAVTALTVQDTVNVSDFRVLDREWVLAQANAVLADLPVAAVKLGMLGSLEMVDTVAEILAAHPHLPVVCDPVLRAGGGGALGKGDVGFAMRERLLPRATIATPNLPEARLLADLSEGSADQCAERLLEHCEHLLITGGHGDESEVHNRLYSRDGSRRTFTCQRLPGSYHGSGCTLASALAGRIALGEALHGAVQSALDYTWRTLRDAESPGHGQYVPRRLPTDFCH